MKYKDYFEDLLENVSEAGKFSKKQIETVYKESKYSYDFDEFCMGMTVELEHSDITNGDPYLTAKIVAAHLNEVPNYYTLLKLYVEK